MEQSPTFEAQFNGQCNVLPLSKALHYFLSCYRSYYTSYLTFLLDLLLSHLPFKNTLQHIYRAIIHKGGAHSEHPLEIIGSSLVPLKPFCIMHFMIIITQPKLKYTRCNVSGNFISLTIYLPYN